MATSSSSQICWTNSTAKRFIGRDQQRKYFENEFERIVADIRQLVEQITIDGDVQQIVDGIEQQLDGLWAHIFASNQQHFEETLTDSERLQDAIESRITPADRKDPLVQTAVSDMRGTAQQLHIEMTLLCLQRQDLFDDDVQQLVKAMRRLHDDSAASQSNFLKVLDDVIALMRERFGDYFDRNSQIFTHLNNRYWALAKLVVTNVYPWSSVVMIFKNKHSYVEKN